MNDLFYKKAIEELSAGYAYHKIICDVHGEPCDYEFIEVNPAFEALTGFKGSDIIGKRLTQIMPSISGSEFDWISRYGEIAIHGGENDFKQYSEFLKRWYKIKVYSPQKYYFITVFIDMTSEMKKLSKLQRIVELSEEFLQMSDVINYQKISDDFLHLTDAKYLAFNLFDQDGESFTTVSISGDKGIIKKATELVGFKIKNKKWPADPIRLEKIKKKPLLVLTPSVN